jgi:hypothetical protein
MAGRKYLSKRQLTVLDDLFNSELDEQAVLDKHKVRRSTYDRWLADKVFAERFKQYVNGLKRRSELLMAQYSQLAATKLVHLTGSEKEETARKACLDIISLSKLAADNNAKPTEPQPPAKPQTQQLSHQTAGRLLAALAEEKGETLR